MLEEAFFTFREYMKKEGDHLTASMEDYLEMIYRLSQSSTYTRINELASALNVQPPSATKMVQKLAELELVNYKKYGIIMLSTEGLQIGKALLHRHAIIESFLQLLGVSEGLLEETEKIEHTIGIDTLKRLDDFVAFLSGREDIICEFKSYRDTKSLKNNVEE